MLTFPDPSQLPKKASAFAHYAFSRRALPVYKGALAYLLGYTLIFIRKFNSLNSFPATFTSITIMLVIGGAGKSVGACIQATFLALLGVGCGAACFALLGVLVDSQVAQGFVFAAIVYFFSVIKALNAKYFAFALLAILMSFNGIYASILEGKFIPAYLEQYLKVYCWGAAIVLTVNILIFPVTSEKELRQTLTLSLEHIATFSHLLAKGYTLELTEEERIVRDQLSQNIRADFGYLTQKIDETSLEINWSKFSMTDYQGFVGRTRGMQLALITAYSSLYHMEKKDKELFKTRFLPSTMASFNQLRGALNVTMREISSVLGLKVIEIPSNQPGYAEFMDIESQTDLGNLTLERQITQGSIANSVDERLANVSRRLAEEYGEDDISDDESIVSVDLDEQHEPEDEGQIHEVQIHEDNGLRPLSRSMNPSHVHFPVDPSGLVGAEAVTDVEKQQAEHTMHPPSPVNPRVLKNAVSVTFSTKTPRTPQHDREKQTGYCIRSLRRIFDRFSSDQHNILAQCLEDGNLHGADDSLRLLEPMPSLRDMYEYKYVPVAVDGDPEKRNSYGARRIPRRKRRTWMDVQPDTAYGSSTSFSTPYLTTEGTMSHIATPERKAGEDVYYEVLRPKTMQDQKADEIATASHHSLTRVYSFMFAMEQFVEEIEAMYYCTRKPAAKKARLHVHFYENIQRPHQRAPPRPLPTAPTSIHASTAHLTTPSTTFKYFDGIDLSEKDLGVAESLALLEHRNYKRPRPNIWQRLEVFEQWLRGPVSIFAAKTAAAGAVFAVLILHPVPRPWFIKFGLSSGALTIMTALSPTLGQSILAWVLQILGSGFGYLYALILLEIFKNVGGYPYNPYGIVCLLIPYALALTFILYERPKYFVAALLAMNGTATMLLLEWINKEVEGNRNYDSPPLRFGKSMAMLGVVLGIAAVFQLFVLRNPARRTLRKRIGAMMFAQLSYATLLQAYVRGSMPSDPSRRAPEAALKRVDEEMRHRELKLQAELIALRPLVQFAAAEPQFSRPFRADVINRLLRTSQIILDRMRECRTAIAGQPLPDSVLENFVQILAPYRRRNSQILQLEFYLVASSLMSKSPLLRETPAELEGAPQIANFMHDVLVLASKHARTEEGAKTIRSGAFTRYFHYIVGITSLNGHLLHLEEACKDYFGELEDHLA